MSRGIMGERLLTLAAARDWIRARTGSSRSCVTLHRWASVGIRGVVLESCLVGGTRYTSEEALVRFVERLSAGAADPPQCPWTTARRREVEAIHGELGRIFGSGSDRGAVGAPAARDL